MIDKKNLLTSDWKSVENYLKKDTDDSIRLAIIESEKVFLKVVNSKGYSAKKKEDRIEAAIKELKNPDGFLKAREKYFKLIEIVGFDIGDPYSGKEVVNSYKEAINDLLFGIIDEKSLSSFKYRFWHIYFYLYSNRRFIKKFFTWFAIIVLVMLFIADTDIGRNIFDLLIEKIHLIIRTILVILLLLFMITFFITFSIILIESKAKKRAKKRE